MKFLVLIISLFCSAQALAMTSSEMRDKGCIPYRNDDGTITMKCKVEQYKIQDNNQANRQLELRAGDVITEINGESVDSPEKAMELYNSQKATSMSIERRLQEARGIHEETTDNN
jgi:PDZ domain-containing secreted protein